MKYAKHLILFLLGAGVVGAANPPRNEIVISVNSNVAGGSALYVAVDRPDFGSLTVTGAVRMFSSGGNQWTGRIAVAGHTVSNQVRYKLFSRTTTSGTHCDAANGVLPSATLTSSVPVWSPGFVGKKIIYHSSWTNAFVIYRQGIGTNFLQSQMTRVGAGRTGGEYRYEISGIGTAGEPIEFVMRGYTAAGVEQYDNAPYAGYGLNNYCTPLDTFFLQDGNLFNYNPPATVSAPQVITVSSWASSYTGNGIPSRGGRIYLPRGYTQNTSRRYPVLYMHDGQNVFDPGGSFGSWSADATATKEISQGRMRETIIVAINNSNNRMSEYGTPQDGYTGNFYLNYVVNNVRPAINSGYRTLTNFWDTGVMGSSLGGLISAYMGLSTNVFGLIGAVSPSYWYGPNFRSWINTQPTKGNRIYQDAGTTEGASMWDYFWPVYTYYLQDGYNVNDDLLAVIGCGQAHNEAAWASRIHLAYRFLLNPLEEVNSLETNVPPSPGTIQFSASTYSVSETGGVLRVLVTRMDGSNGAASVQIATSNGTAVAASDFVQTNAVLSWADGDSSNRFMDIVILDDLIYEGDESFQVVLSSATGAAMGTPSTATVTVVENDPVPPDLVITNPPGDITVAENVAAVDLQGRLATSRWAGIRWTNALTGGSGSLPASDPWAVPGVAIGVGTNSITVLGTNQLAGVVTNASDNASAAVYADGWTASDNGGFGFGSWQFFTTSTNVNLNGRFVGTNAAIDIGRPAWGLYANSATNLSEAKRTLGSPMAVGDTFFIRFDNGFIDSGQSVGVALQNGTGATIWEYYFIGGEQFYRITGGTTDVGWTSSGMDIEVTRTGAGTYRSIVRPYDGEARTNVGNLAVPNGTITVARVWNYAAGAGSDYDVFFNDMLHLQPGEGGPVTTSATVNVVRPAPALHDGIPMTWWNRYGLGTNTTAAGNEDGDEASNWEEYIADTDPTNPASIYSNRIESVSGSGVLGIRTGLPTTNSRLYDVWWTTNLLEGPWLPLNKDVPGAPDGGSLWLVVTNSADAGHFRTSVKLP